MRYALFLRSLVIAGSLLSSYSYGQLVVTPSQPAAVLAAKLAGPGITVSSPVLTCAGAANGTFISTATPIVIDSGIILTSGRAVNTAGAESFLASTNNGTAGDAALTTLAGIGTHDACVLEFDFIPNGDTVSFNYQFGSEEYVNSTCGQYNDAFAFFISGPGISGTQNMALVPGTNIPVTVNSINNGIPGPAGYPGYCNILNCTSMGPGSPFTSYYYDNSGGTRVTYKGYTRKLTAFHQVIPCNTYHLKMAIADASNSLYDSGVFIEAGSLKTNTFRFDHLSPVGYTVNGVPNTIVKGCSPTTVTVFSGHATGAPQTVNFNFGGTAVQGVDFTCPSSATINPGDTSVTISVAGITTPPGGTKTIQIYLLSPFSCGVVDTINLSVMDTPSAHIITPDTSICLGTSFLVNVVGTAGLAYNWSPAATLSSASAMQPVMTPIVHTTYTMVATLPGAGCPPIVRSIDVIVNTAAVSIITPDTAICRGASVDIAVNGSSTTLAYSWSPSLGLDSANVKEPTATPNVTTTYSLTATSLIGGCPAYDTIRITIIIPTINVLTPSIAICPHSSLTNTSATIQVAGDPTFLYSWSPAIGLDNASIQQPSASPDAETIYTVTATVAGTPCTTTGTATITILPELIATASAGKSVCINEPIELHAMPKGLNFSYQWYGPNSFNSLGRDPYIANAHLENGGIYTVTVTDNTTTCSNQDTALQIVGDASLSLKNVTKSQTIKYGASIQLNASNATIYTWTPNDGTLDDPNINNPVAKPLQQTTYTVTAVNELGCIDTASVTIDVSFEETIFIPTGFTPNNDGTNDHFRVANIGNYKLVEMSVYNRWGELIYHTTEKDNTGWDGSYKGIPQDMGVYNYAILVSDPYNKVESFKGSVTLIR